MSTPYHPIACDYHSELELWCLHKTRCTIVAHDEAGQTQTLQAVIRDIVTRDKQEFVLLDDGSAIRLDRLISVNGKHRADYPASD